MTPNPDTLLTMLVAGHRAPPRLPENATSGPLAERLDQIIATCISALARQAHWRLLTGLAPGTDTLAAAIAERYQLPLHLLSAGSHEPLTADQARAERLLWLGALDIGDHGDEPRRIRDQTILAFADLVLMVWDGESPLRRSGGTVRLAFQAACLMKPMIWLATDGTVRLLDRALLTPERLYQLQTPHPDPGLLRQCFGSALTDPELADALRHEMSVYLQQCETAQPTGAIPTAAHGVDVLESRRAQCAQAAKRLSRWHRLFSWLLYLASALAVFAAVAGAIALWPGNTSPVWPITELVLISGIVIGVIVAKSRHWHGRWISQRFIAEQLRYVRPCLPVLAIPEHFLEPAWQVKDGTLALVSPERLYLQRTLALHGLPLVERDAPALCCAPAMQSLQLERLQRILEDQRQYHRRKHRQLHRQHHILHGISLILFAATFLAVILHFVLHAAWLLIFTAFFPALAAALHGLSVKFEIRRLAGQSQAAAQELAALQSAIQALKPEPTWESWMRVRQITLNAARVLSQENIDWQELISHQEAELPA